jgi:hypothetical protein
MPEFTSHKYSFQGLLVTILFIMIAYPLLHPSNFTRLIFQILITGILIFSIYSLIQNKRQFAIGLFLAVPTLALGWIGLYTSAYSITVIGLMFRILFFGYIIFVFLTSIFKTRKITSDLIYGSICIYLLMGIEWSFIYSLSEVIRPGSFELSSIIQGTEITTYDTHSISPHFIYFSFTTLTTLGYGDILPKTLSSKFLTSLEAITGQFYVAVLVARLVALHLIQNPTPPR